MVEIKTLLRRMLGMDGYIPSAKELLRKLPTLFPRWWLRVKLESLWRFFSSNPHFLREVSRSYLIVRKQSKG